jgi:hypothetical protein
MIQIYSTMIISRFLLADGNLKNNASRGSLRIRKKKGLHFDPIFNEKGINTQNSIN